MFSITPKQHSRILGFSLIAYSWSLFLPSLKILIDLQDIFDRFRDEIQYSGLSLISVGSYFYQEFGNIFLVLIILFSGISILTGKGKLKFFSLLFVLFYINVFPIGTILCFYTLLYLFVISENKTEENLLKETK